MLYHVNAYGIPKTLYGTAPMDLVYSPHAIYAAYEDIDEGKKRPDFRKHLPLTLDPSKWNLIEVDVSESGVVNKYLFRNKNFSAFEGQYDLILVVIPADLMTYTVVTCWIQPKEDNHDTLDKTKYCKP